MGWIQPGQVKPIKWKKVGAYLVTVAAVATSYLDALPPKVATPVGLAAGIILALAHKKPVAKKADTP